MSRLKTNYTVTYANNNFVITYASVFLATAFSAFSYVTQQLSGNFFEFGGDIYTLNVLDWTKCTSPAAVSYSDLIAKIALLITPIFTSPTLTGTISIQGTVTENDSGTGKSNTVGNASNPTTLNNATVDTLFTVGSSFLRNGHGVNVPDPGVSGDTLPYIGRAQVWTGAQYFTQKVTMSSSNPLSIDLGGLNNPANFLTFGGDNTTPTGTQLYILPYLGAGAVTDSLVTKAVTQTLSNKTGDSTCTWNGAVNTSSITTDTINGKSANTDIVLAPLTSTNAISISGTGGLKTASITIGGNASWQTYTKALGTLTLTGPWTATQTITYAIVRMDSEVRLYLTQHVFPSTTGGASATITTTAVPAGYRPSTIAQYGKCFVVNLSNTQDGVFLVGTDGTMTIYVSDTASTGLKNFTGNSGVAGLRACALSWYII
jgi:hypothetical protein